MDKTPPAPMVCEICKKPQKPSNVVPAELVTGAVLELIRKACPTWSSGSFICLPISFSRTSGSGCWRSNAFKPS